MILRRYKHLNVKTELKVLKRMKMIIVMIIHAKIKISNL